MKEAISYSFRVDTNVLVVNFFEPYDDMGHEYDVGTLGTLDSTLIGDNSISQLIFHINEKSWASISLLYDLAVQIDKYCPRNTIDWKKTFLNIELIKLGKEYVNENSISSDINSDWVEDESASSGHMMDRVMMHVDFMRNIDENKVKEVSIKVETELRKKGLL